MDNQVEILDLSIKERNILARKVGIKPVYLWQCGAGLRTPRLRVAEKLMRHEPRLTVTSLMAPYHRLLAKQAKLKKAK